MANCRRPAISMDGAPGPAAQRTAEFGERVIRKETSLREVCAIKMFQFEVHSGARKTRNFDGSQMLARPLE
jgi:hypothetical protein